MPQGDPVEVGGVPLAARFSLATNRLRYCGPAEAETPLYAAITRGESLAEARRALLGFEALAPYLEAIARKHRRDPFDPEVVEAYWVGNELLRPFGRREFEALLDALVGRGLPRSLADRLKSRLPEHPVPHHAFHVCFVGVGEVTGHVATTVANMEACRPSWAEVLGVEHGKLHLSRSVLGLRDGRVALLPAARGEVPFDPQVLPHVGRGDVVALHWGWPAYVLSKDQLLQLQRYTQLALQAVPVLERGERPARG